MGRVFSLYTAQTWDEYLSYFVLRNKATGIAHRTVKYYTKTVKHFFQCYPDALLSQVKLDRSVLEYFLQRL